MILLQGNKGRQVTQDLMAKLPDFQKNKRGITVDGLSFHKRNRILNDLPYADHLRMDGADGSIFAIGDCTATSYAPTAQVASQQGAYLARILAQMAKKDILEEKLATLEGAVSNGTGEERKQIAEEKEVVQRQLAKVKLRPFHYSHQGSLA